jgi:hypothetical protein
MTEIGEITIARGLGRGGPRGRPSTGQSKPEIPAGVASDRWQAIERVFIRRLNLRGGMTTAQRAAINRCAALTVAAERTRNDFLRGAVDALSLDMVERALARAEKNLLKLACDPRSKRRGEDYSAVFAEGR